VPGRGEKGDDEEMIFIPTVMHSGTRFLHQLIGWPVQTLAKAQFVDGTIIHCHMDTRSEKFTRALTCPIVVPMRHPARIYESWARRNFKSKHPEKLEAQFRRMIREVHPHSPTYVVIDHEDRDLHLKRLNDRFGLALKTDWCPVSEKGTSDVEITRKRMARVPDFVMDFYEEITDGRH